jgi:hypothetical protein
MSKHCPTCGNQAEPDGQQQCQCGIEPSLPTCSAWIHGDGSIFKCGKPAPWFHGDIKAHYCDEHGPEFWGVLVTKTWTHTPNVPVIEGGAT